MKETTDHRGERYPSRAAMCRAHGLQHTTVIKRLKAGWSLERALTTPSASRGPRAGIYSQDHRGQTFESLTAMARAYGKTPVTVTHRLERGYTMRQALTFPSNAPRLAIKVTDHTGREWPSHFAMARAYGLDPGTVRSRIVKGWSVERALTTPAARGGHLCAVPFRDHRGREFRTLSDMARAYGLKPWTLFSRLREGKPLDAALTAPVRRYRPKH